MMMRGLGKGNNSYHDSYLFATAIYTYSQRYAARKPYFWVSVANLCTEIRACRFYQPSGFLCRLNLLVERNALCGRISDYTQVKSSITNTYIKKEYTMTAKETKHFGILYEGYLKKIQLQGKIYPIINAFININSMNLTPQPRKGSDYGYGQQKNM